MIEQPKKETDIKKKKKTVAQCMRLSNPCTVDNVAYVSRDYPPPGPIRPVEPKSDMQKKESPRKSHCVQQPSFPEGVEREKRKRKRKKKKRRKRS
jgi:hypothetical protein